MFKACFLAAKGGGDYAEASRLTIESDITRQEDNIMMINFHIRYKATFLWLASKSLLSFKQRCSGINDAC